MIKIAVANQKGGCGKTTCSINVAAGLAYSGKKVLLVDLDPQGGSTIGLGVNVENKQTVAELLCQDDCTIKNVLQETYIKGLHILPSDVSLSVADLKLAQTQAKEFVLRTKLVGLKYDYVIIDTPPTLGTLLTNATLAADYFLLPIGLDYLNLNGAQNLIDTIGRTNKKVGQLVNHQAEILGIVFTYFKTNTNLSKEMFKTINELFGDQVFKSRIPENVRIKESQAAAKSIFDFAPNSPSAIAYTDLTKEIERRLKHVKNR